MFLKSQIHLDLIKFFLVLLQIFKTCFPLNTIEFPEIDYLANNLSPNECVQLYNKFQYRHIRKEEIQNYIHKRGQTIPCISMLATWLTNPEELNFKTVDNVSSKLTEIGRQDLALWLNRSLIHRKNEMNLNDFSRDKDLENEIVYKTVRDERLQRSTCPQPTRNTSIFWKFFFAVLIILFLFFLCCCCCYCIYEKLRCTCGRTDLNYCGNKEEKEEEEYCLCDEKFKTSIDDYYAKKKSSHFKRVFSNFQQYFKNRQEKNKEKLRSERFQKLKRKLQQMYEEKRKEIRVNRQEEKILNSLTEKERDELGEIICEMTFFLDSDKETERLLLSEKRSGTFIIDMKNLHQPKITRSHESSQEIKTIKKWDSRDRFSTSLSEEMSFCVLQPRTSSENDILKSNHAKKHVKKSNCRRKKHLNQNLKNENSIFNLTELEVKSEFIKCYVTSESEQNYSTPVIRETERFLQEKSNSNFSTSDDFSTFRSKNEKSQNSSLTQTLNKIQSDFENSKRNSTNLKLESAKINHSSRCSFQKEKIEPEKNEHYFNYSQNKSSNLKKKDETHSKSSLLLNLTCSKKILEKDSIPLFKNLDRGDTKSQVDLCETCDELGYLFSQYMKQQSQPCYRNYCLIRRHLKQKSHDLKHCRVKKNYFQYYPQGQAPSCSSGKICRATYDEFYLMRASPQERIKIRQSVYERRKKFLDQPCISPRRHILQKMLST